ncbi:lipopolysaccharide biosynthesis protein [Gloeothece verrucosa]|uniref:Polysaccharide biosynthesis protein n=1 Tax=Gloeothece verrucosa (strain PCC 7822) TaxID=497965 RepID=E0UD44_GLOV7|nr:lipopolysaccharide biosynthesis protein [Gloeothece verrucosa]ADN12924.1 polysaccharide biosynthesis protein [Gloeothece verrucosa PCC 7822]
MLFNILKAKLKQIDSPFVRNVGWLGGSGAVIRVSRLITTVILARFLSSYDYGLAAIILTTNEFIRVFSRNGVGIRLIQGDEKQLEALSQSAYWLNWVVFAGLFGLQCGVAFPLAWFYDDKRLILPICAMALNLLLIPFGLVQAALLQREGRFKVIALTEMLQISTDNILSGILAFFGLGMWAIVLPKILVAPIWVYIIIKNHAWRPHGQFTTRHWGELFQFGRNILGVELLYTLRANLDYLIIGRFLSVEALGIYYFAFNAGLGISLSVMSSIKSALLPHLCDARAHPQLFKARYYHSLKTIGLILIPLVLLQSGLAPFYVPLVFGHKWIPAIPILILICLSAISRPFADSASQLLLAVDQPQKDLMWNLIFTAIFAVGLLIGVHWQSLGVAFAVLLTHLICLPVFTLWVMRYVFRTQLQYNEI